MVKLCDFGTAVEQKLGAMQGLGFRIWVLGFRVQGVKNRMEKHMSFSLNSLKGGYIGDYIGFRV